MRVSTSFHWKHLGSRWVKTELFRWRFWHTVLVLGFDNQGCQWFVYPAILGTCWFSVRVRWGYHPLSWAIQARPEKINSSSPSPPNCGANGKMKTIKTWQHLGLLDNDKSLTTLLGGAELRWPCWDSRILTSGIWGPQNYGFFKSHIHKWNCTSK